MVCRFSANVHDRLVIRSHCKHVIELVLLLGGTRLKKRLVKECPRFVSTKLPIDRIVNFLLRGDRAAIDSRAGANRGVAQMVSFVYSLSCSATAHRFST